MFTIVITDKAGSKKRIEFTKPNVDIGRTQDNDIILAKGNVSKRHASLILQDSGFVISDAQSTNGTYVNGRKLTAPMSVSKSDKIYVGDFVLTIEPSSLSSAPKQPPQTILPGAASHTQPPSAPIPAPVPNPPSAPEARQAETRPQPVDVDALVDQFRLDRKPDSNAEDQLPQHSSITPSVVEFAPDRLGPLGTLMARVAERFDVHNIEPAALHDQGRWNQAQASIAETIQSMQSDGSFTPGVDTKKLARAALHESVGLGPLDALLSNENVQEIIVSGVGRLHVDDGSGLKRVDHRFSSNTVLHTIAQRLAAQTGRRLTRKPVFQGVLSFGPHITIIQPPLAIDGPIIEIRTAKEQTLDALVDEDWMTEQMRAHVERAIGDGKNIAVVGPQGSGVTTLLSALYRHFDEDSRTIVVEAIADLSVDRGNVVSLSSADTELSLGEVVQEASRLRADHLVVDDLSGKDLRDTLVAISSREPGHLLGVHASGGENPIESMLNSLETSLVISPEAASRLIASTVDLVLQVSRQSTGHRVLRIDRIIELDGTSIDSETLFERR